MRAADDVPSIRYSSFQEAGDLISERPTQRPPKELKELIAEDQSGGLSYC